MLDEDEELALPAPDATGFVLLGLILAAVVAGTAAMDIRWTIVSSPPATDVSPPPPPPPPPPQTIWQPEVAAVPPVRKFEGPPGRVCWSLAKRLRIRSAPTTKSDVVGYLVQPDAARCLMLRDGWHTVVGPDGRQGYVSARWITEEAPVIDGLVSRAQEMIDAGARLEAWRAVARMTWESSLAWKALASDYRSWALHNARATGDRFVAYEERLAVLECDSDGPTNKGLYAGFHVLTKARGRHYDHPDLFLRQGGEQGAWAAFHMNGTRLWISGGLFERVDGPMPCTVRIASRWKHATRLSLPERFALGLGIGNERVERHGG